jgi:predicted nucleic acid-binding protein
VILYLVDSTALWRLERDPGLNDGWAEDIEVGAIGSCAPQRIEFRRSARNSTEFDDMTSTFHELYRDVPTPKGAWAWIDAAQFRLATRGQHQALSVVDWLICATAAHHGLTVLHDDHDFRSAAKHLPDVSERNVHDI